jgi:hypothetical protein
MGSAVTELNAFKTLVKHLINTKISVSDQRQVVRLVATESLEDAKKSATELIVAIQNKADSAALMEMASAILLNLARVEQAWKSQASASLSSTDDSAFDVDAASSPSLEEQEARKVRGRLRLWAKRSHQYNHRILRLYLELAGARSTPVTIEEMEQAFVAQGLGDAHRFQTNFAQMTNIAPNNHGKVFEVDLGEVGVWPPVADAVSTFAQQVIGDDS